MSYAGFIFEQPTIPVLVVLFGLAGIHDAFQQSLEKSLAAELLPASVRGTGFGVNRPSLSTMWLRPVDMTRILAPECNDPFMTRTRETTPT